MYKDVRCAQSKQNKRTGGAQRLETRQITFSDVTHLLRGKGLTSYSIVILLQVRVTGPSVLRGAEDTDGTVAATADDVTVWHSGYGPDGDRRVYDRLSTLSICTSASITVIFDCGLEERVTRLAKHGQYGPHRPKQCHHSARQTSYTRRMYGLTAYRCNLHPWSRRVSH
jgi:hypothetical protein